MNIDATVIQDYVAGRLDREEHVAVERAAGSSEAIARSVQDARTVQRRVERRLSRRATQGKFH